MHPSIPLFRDRMADIKQIGRGGSQGTVVYDDRTYYVEWKKYGWSASEESRRRIQDSIVNLAMLLNAPKHPVFRTLNCVGIVDEPRSERLSCQLVQALFYLHLSNWMHKSLSSHNILFFPESSKAARSLADPYIVGFSYSREDAAGEPSQKLDRDPLTDLYRHSDCLEDDYAGFHKTYDVYSLGLVLFEIVKWRLIKETFLRTARAKAVAARGKSEKDLTKEELRELDETLLKECKVQDIKDMRKDLLDPDLKDSHPTDLAFRAGDKFKQIVLTCLGDEFDRVRKGKNDSEFRETFFQRVWRPLEKLTAV